MTRYRLSRQSRADLGNIWDYIASDNVAAADGLIDRIVEKLGVLAAEPGIGRTRSELAEALRSFPVGNYVIFYRALQDGIEVVRILHGARDIPDLFTEGE